MDAYLMDTFDQLFHEQLHQTNSRKLFSAPHDDEMSFRLLFMTKTKMAK